MLKLAFVTSFPDDPSQPHGGVEAVSVNLVRSLSQFEDLDIHVVTTRRDRRSHSTGRWGRATVHRLPWAGGSMLRHAVGPGRRQIQRYLRDLRPDLIHAHDTYGLIVKGMDIPRVFTIHGFIYGDTRISREKLSALRWRIWRWVETRGWADQPHIISISPYVRERLRGIASGVIHDIENPVNQSFFDIQRAEQPGRIVSAALVCRRKNALALIDAVGQLTAEGIDVELRLAGTCSEASYEQRLRRRIKELDLAGHVRLLGSLPMAELQQELAAASVFALVSLEENAPMGIEEAMAAGVPIVTSNRCGMPYMVRDGESGYLADPVDISDIAQRLKSLLLDEELRNAMGVRSRQMARDLFHPDAIARRTRHVYLRAMERSGSTRNS